MPEDRLERKTYRKSPGRQYGYEYDPLQSHSGRSHSGSTASRSGVVLSQRPDPRRTRQLLRQSIIASRRPEDEMAEDVQPELHKSSVTVDRSRPTRRIHHSPSEDPGPSAKHIARTHFVPMSDDSEPPSPRYGAYNSRVVASPAPYLPSTRELMHEDEVVQEAWPQQAQERFVDPDLGIDEDEDLDDLEQETYDYAPQTRGMRADGPLRASSKLRPRNRSAEEFPDQDLDDDYIYDEDEELPPGLHVVKKPSSSRRKFLIGAGVVVAGGVTVGLAASQSGGPKALIPPVINNVDKQMKEAFNQGADQAKRELLASLDTIENFTLQGAIDAARLTRTAYDVFVSPILKSATAVTSDFLVAMLNALGVARNWLKTINHDDSVTLAAVQKVLQSWVDNVRNLPKQLEAITDTDLDGAQAYLRALKQKIEEEKKALSNPNPTPPVKSSPPAKKP